MRETYLKKIIYKSGYRQKHVAEQTGIPENRLTQAVTGRYDLSDDERQYLADFLDKPVAELFPEGD